MAHTLTSGTGHPALIVCDTLNFLSRFVPVNEVDFTGASPAELLCEAKARFLEFVQAIRAARIRIVFVFDNGQSTEESNAKWIQRRKEEVEKEHRALPYQAERFLWAIILDHELTVYSPFGIDGDDAVAMLAFKLDGHVLSRDQDMLRYGLARGRVLSDFAIRGGKIVFSVRTQQSRVQPRHVEDIPFSPDQWIIRGSLLALRIKRDQWLRGGNPDSHTKRRGNLNVLARPVRAALYARLGVSSVREIYPEWRRGECELVTTTVQADKCHDVLLDQPVKLFDWLQSSNAGDARGKPDRVHACAILTAELYDAATPPDERASATRIRDVYMSLNPLPKREHAKRRWAAGGRCAGLRGSRGCQGDGMCFQGAIEHAAWIGKDPLCQQCISTIQSFSEMRRVREGVGGIRM